MKMEDLGKHLRKFRKSKRMTQRELAKRIGVTPQLIGQWEIGTANVPHKRMKPLEDVLGIKFPNIDLRPWLDLEDEEVIGKKMEEENLPLYKWISRVRIMRGMTKRELAKRVGVTPQAVGQWETPLDQGGTEPRRSRMVSIETALGTKYPKYPEDPDDLRHTSGDNDKETGYLNILKNRTGDLLERRLMLIEDILHADDEVITMVESLITRLNK